MTKESKKKIKRAIFAEGAVHVQNLGVVSSLDSEKHECEMELKPFMLSVKRKGEELWIPLTHIKQMLIVDE